jgi:hypothetical protein
MNIYRIIIGRLALTAFLFLILIEPSYAHKKTEAPPAFVFGIWRIYRFEEVGGHTTEKAELAQKEIGRTVKFGRSAFTYDKNFLWFGQRCAPVRYKFEVHSFGEHNVMEKGSLEFYGLEAAKRNCSQKIIVLCKGRPLYYFELAKGNQLAIYYDGWFFFLEKIK